MPHRSRVRDHYGGGRPGAAFGSLVKPLDTGTVRWYDHQMPQDTGVRPPKSDQFTRQQLLGMVAELRAGLFALVYLSDDPNDVGYNRQVAIQTIDRTNMDAVEADLVNGSLDMSWRPE